MTVKDDEVEQWVDKTKREWMDELIEERNKERMDRWMNG